MNSNGYRFEYFILHHHFTHAERARVCACNPLIICKSFSWARSQSCVCVYARFPCGVYVQSKSSKKHTKHGEKRHNTHRALKRRQRHKPHSIFQAGKRARDSAQQYKIYKTPHANLEHNQGHTQCTRRAHSRTHITAYTAHTIDRFLKVWWYTRSLVVLWCARAHLNPLCAAAARALEPNLRGERASACHSRDDSWN